MIQIRKASVGVAVVIGVVAGIHGLIFPGAFCAEGSPFGMESSAKELVALVCQTDFGIYAREFERLRRTRSEKKLMSLENQGRVLLDQAMEKKTISEETLKTIIQLNPTPSDDPETTKKKAASHRRLTALLKSELEQACPKKIKRRKPQVNPEEVISFVIMLELEK